MGLNKQALQHIYAYIQNYVVNGIKWRYILSVSIITLKHVGFENMVTRHGTTIELNIRVYNFNFVRVPETATFARYKFCTTITSHTILNKATIYMFTNIHYLQVQYFNIDIKSLTAILYPGQINRQMWLQCRINIKTIYNPHNGDIDSKH